MDPAGRPGRWKAAAAAGWASSSPASGGAGEIQDVLRGSYCNFSFVERKRERGGKGEDKGLLTKGPIQTAIAPVLL